MLIFKICDRAEWAGAVAIGSYLGSFDDRRDGFIHLSTAQQLQGTADTHFAGRDNLVLVAFNDDDLSETLRWEASRGGQLFPHVYGTLDTGDARWTKPLPLGPDGHVLPGLED